MKLSLRLLFLALLCCVALDAEARVIRVEMRSGAPISADLVRGTPAYERISARVFFAVRPEDERNKAIVDLDKARRNAAGEVEFSADLSMLRPIGMKNNGALLLEIPNRGGKGLLSLVDGGKAEPANASEMGDAWLLRQGFTFASLGWQWDVDDRQPGNLKLYAPIAYLRKGGAEEHIAGLLRDDFTPT